MYKTLKAIEFGDVFRIGTIFMDLKKTIAFYSDENDLDQKIIVVDTSVGLEWTEVHLIITIPIWMEYLIDALYPEVAWVEKIEEST